MIKNASCLVIVDELEDIADAAEAARVYLERTNASVETVNRATEIRLLAERQMGEFLQQMPKNDGGRPTGKTGASREPVSTLAEIGITKKQSATAQKLAAIPAPEFRDRIAVAKIAGRLSNARVLKPVYEATIIQRGRFRPEAEAFAAELAESVRP